MKNGEAKMPPAAKTRLPEAIRRLIDLYTAWDKPAEAAEWRVRLDSMNGLDQPRDEPKVMP